MTELTNIAGSIRLGQGVGAHHAPWSWHIDPQDVIVNFVSLVPVATPTPTEVEANLAALLAQNSDKMTITPGGVVRAVEDLRGVSTTQVQVSGSL